MDIGKIGVFLGLGASIASIVLYLISLRGNRKVLLAARAAYAVTAASVVFCFFRLAFLIYTKQFNYKYVFEYSSRELRFPWTFAATWAGQEGSFLLWAFWTAIIGGLVAWKAGKWENRMMPLFITVITCLFAILAWLSPYNVIPRGGPNGWPLEATWPPVSGKGLHPSLQNYWMAIHPPTIFFGFSSLAVPFCFAVAAMIWKEYDTWAPRVMPWVLMTVATLGVGLFMGGYWAYETLGWHGFWAWDPVENASLFPWLGSLALLHGLVVQKSRGGMGRTNIFLAVFSWVAFLWGTYLTRSGVLSNFSVHSFVSLSSQPLILIIVMISGYSLLGLLMLAWRWKKIPGRPVSDKALSRDTAMVLAVSLMILASFIVAFGTSFPLLATKFPALKHLRFFDYDPDPSKHGAALLPIFYNKTGATIIIPILIVMGVVPFLAWGKTNAEKFISRVLVPWFLALAGGFAVVYFVLTEAASGVNISKQFEVGKGFQADTPRMLVVAVATLGLFAAAANILLAVKVLRTKSRITMGGWLAHVGIGMLLLGTVITNVYEKTAVDVIIEGEKPVKTPFGYSLAYLGWSHDAKEKELRETTDPAREQQLKHEITEEWRKFDHSVRFQMTKLGSSSNVVNAADNATPSADSADSFVAEMHVFENNQNPGGMDEEQMKYMRWPYIHKEPFRDVYVSISNDPENALPSATVRPEETARLAYFYNGGRVLNTEYQVHYKRFYMDGQPGQSGTVMRAELEVRAPDGRIGTANPGLKIGPAGPVPVISKISGMQGVVQMAAGMDASTKAVQLNFLFPEEGSRWIMPIQVTNKPMINLVWIGVIVMGLGTLVAMVRRSLEARKGALIESSAAIHSALEEDEEEAPKASELSTSAPAKPRKAATTKAARAKMKP